MKTFIIALFPLFNWLSVFQMVGYNRTQFIRWILKNRHVRTGNKIPVPQPTLKAIVIFLLSMVLIIGTYSLCAVLMLNFPIPCNFKILALSIFLFIRLRISFLDLYLAGFLIRA